VPRKVQSESDFIPVSGKAALYNFSISPTCGFAFGTCFQYTPHPALKRLINTVVDSILKV